MRRYRTLAWLVMAVVPASPGHAQAPAGLANVVPGAFKFKWIHGSVAAARNRDPRIQVAPYNQDTIVMRENIAVHWEAPFTYLLIGQERALLIDTGATPQASYYPLRATVDGILRRIASLRGVQQIPLVVAHTSGEDIAQNQGVNQFRDRPQTTLVPLDLAGMKRHYAFAQWPQGEATIDLGGRAVTVLPAPGTHKDGVAFYDRQTGLLFTGDLLFPGRIQISNDADYVATLERLNAFAQNHPLQWVLGGHIDMTAVAGVCYLRHTNFKPNEHFLQLDADAIGEALKHARPIVGKPAAIIRADFLLLNRVSPDEEGPWPADLPPAAPRAVLR